MLGLGSAAVYLHGSLQEAREDLALATLQLDTLSARVGTLEGRVGRIQEGVRAVESQRGTNDAVISESLRQNQEWAAEPIPADVTDGLCSFLSCAD